jgi:putative PIN family toxin of toxin-antitoxin system
MTVVFDTNVFVSAAIYHGGTARRCFVLLAKRKFRLAATDEILAEYRTAVEALVQKPGKYHNANWRPLFNWLQYKSVCFEPVSVGKQRSRDADDDIFLSCALAAGAKIIVSKDKDLLDMGKPFGVEIVSPTIFVARFK